MLGRLLKYEFWKKWKSNRYLILGFGLVEIVLLVILKINYNNSTTLNFLDTVDHKLVGTSFSLLTLLYFGLTILFLVYPFTEGIYRYNNDLSGKQSPLELMIPEPSWKKIASKLIATVFVTFICIILSIFFIIMYAFILTNFNTDIVNKFFNVLVEAFKSPAEIIFTFITTLFSFASLYLMFFFCIAVSKWVSHKNKIAVPISIGVFIALITVNTYLQSLAYKFPVISYTAFGTKTSLTTVLLDVLVFAAIFIGTSYIMERKIEC